MNTKIKKVDKKEILKTKKKKSFEYSPLMFLAAL